MRLKMVKEEGIKKFHETFNKKLNLDKNRREIRHRFHGYYDVEASGRSKPSF